MIPSNLALRLVLCTLAGALCAPAPVVFAQSEKTDLSASLQRAERMGRLLYRLDRAAALATDLFLKMPAFQQEHRVEGWITLAHGDDIQVTFVDASPAALYRVTLSPADEVVGQAEVLDVPGALSPAELGAARARALAMREQFEHCAERYNTVVIPSEQGEGDGWSVYLLPGTTQRGIVPLGGSYRIDVRRDAIVSRRAYTKSCIVLESGSRQSPAAIMAVTHLLDPVPTEVHVFWSLWADAPMYVGTTENKMTWLIEAGVITKE